MTNTVSELGQLIKFSVEGFFVYKAGLKTIPRRFGSDDFLEFAQICIRQLSFECRVVLSVNYDVLLLLSFVGLQLHSPFVLLLVSFFSLLSAVLNTDLLCNLQYDHSSCSLLGRKPIQDHSCSIE